MLADALKVNQSLQKLRSVVELATGYMYLVCAICTHAMSVLDAC